MKHKHYDLIVAWANGAEIQVQKKPYSGEWVTLTEAPMWSTTCDYRIKPKEPIRVEASISNLDSHLRMPNMVWNSGMYKNKMRFAFDPDSGELLSVEKI